MSGIVLSASVRQNLLSLQSTADLLATTQNRLSTGKKVNTALDNPTNYFTAQGLDNRANDISNPLDGIGNGVQILQAANTGITSLQSLVDTAKSLANQALQTTVGYSTKSNVSTTISGATSSDLRGTTTFNSASALSNVVANGTAGGASPVTGATTLGGVAAALVGTASKAGDGTAALASTLTLLDTTGTAATALKGNASPRTATFSSSTARPSPSRRVRLRPRPPLPPAPVSPAISSPTGPGIPRFTSAPKPLRWRPWPMCSRRWISPAALPRP
jgi:flagellin